MADLRVIFMGTPDFAVPTLTALLAAEDIEVVAVYTQPPRQAGRGKQPRKTPVHLVAEDNGVPVHTPASLKAEEAQAEFAGYQTDAAIVVAYGLILPAAILRAPRLGCFNLHGSLLPRWRGAAPIQRAIMAGDKMTGVCAMLMDEGLDTGPVLLRAEVPIADGTTAGQLHDRMADIGAPLMVEAIRGVADGHLTAEPQPRDGATYAAKIDKAEARLEWQHSAADLDCLIRGLSPFPGAWCEWQGGRLKVLLATPEDDNHGASPGTVLDDNLLVACGEGALRLRQVQRAGKATMSAEDFQRGTAVKSGDVLT